MSEPAQTVGGRVDTGPCRCWRHGGPTWETTGHPGHCCFRYGNTECHTDTGINLLLTTKGLTVSELSMDSVAEPGTRYISADDTTRLGQLHAAYAAAKAEADAAAELLKTITDGIKLELGQRAHGAERIRLSTPGAPVMQLARSETWRLDSKRLKAEYPETWVRYAVKGESWTLRVLSAKDAE